MPRKNRKPYDRLTDELLRDIEGHDGLFSDTLGEMTPLNLGGGYRSQEPVPHRLIQEDDNEEARWNA